MHEVSRRWLASAIKWEGKFVVLCHVIPRICVHLVYFNEHLENCCVGWVPKKLVSVCNSFEKYPTFLLGLFSLPGRSVTGPREIS